MKISLLPAEIARLKNFLALCEDAEETSDGEWIVDLYEPEALSFELALSADGADVLAAARMAYDEALDGYYIAERIADAEEIARLIRQMGEDAHDQTR